MVTAAAQNGENARLEPGTELHGTWRIERLLGEGGMGTVYQGQAIKSGLPCAIKVMQPRYLADSPSKEAFKREAGLWISLGKHRNLVQAFVVDGYRDTFLIAMELVPKDASGFVTLDNHVRAGRVGTEQALSYGVRICSGLEHAYAAGLRCHRDLKPANVLVSRDGEPRVTDFGLAVARPRIPPPRGVLARIFGQKETPAPVEAGGSAPYMSPEHWDAPASCDQRSDIYSLGVMLFEMASGGRLPFDLQIDPSGPMARARYVYGMRQLHLGAAPLNLDDPIDKVIQRCLSKRPGRRYQTIADLRQALERLEERRAVRIPAPRKQVGLSAMEWSDRGASLRGLGRTDEAIACFEKALQLDDSLGMPYAHLGLIRADEGRLDEAMRCFDKAIDWEPERPEPWYGKGMCLARQERVPQALKCLDTAISVAPDSLDAWRLKGQVLAATRRPREALECFQKAVHLAPDNFYAWLDLGHLNGLIGNYKETARCGRRVAEIVPHRPDGFDLEGHALESLGRFLEAAEAYAKALELKPDDPDAWYCVSAMLGKAGRGEAALPYLDKCLALNPHHEFALANRGAVLSGLGHLDEALQMLERALELDPTDLAALWNKAEILTKLDKPDAARACYEQFVSGARGDPAWAAQVQLALAHLEMNPH